jgi:hypothetical protein
MDNKDSVHTSIDDAHRKRRLVAAGYNLSLLLRWFEELLRALFLMLRCTLRAPHSA